MSIENTGRPGAAAPGSGTPDAMADAEGALFAPTPIWERGRKRRGRMAAAPSAATEAAAAAEPRSFAETPDRPPLTDTRRITETPPMTEPALDRPLVRPLAHPLERTSERPVGAAAVPEDAPDLAAPIGGRTATRRSSALPLAIAAAGVVALGAVGAAGWYAGRPEAGVAELTPGSAASEEDMALAQATPAPTAMATVPPAAMTDADASAVEPAQAPRAGAAAKRLAAPRPSGASRARPATAPSAAEAGINASGTASLPAGPQPYSALAPADDPAADSRTAPAPVVSTPPISPEAAPDPTPSPDEATPPTL